MDNIDGVMTLVGLRVKEFCELFSERDIPNWYNIEGTEGFQLKMSKEGFGFSLVSAAYPIEEKPGSFLITLSTSFLGEDKTVGGFEFPGSPVSGIVVTEYAVNVTDEIELKNAILEKIAGDIENILGKILIA